MKRFYQIVFVSFFCVHSLNIFAQEKEVSIRFANGDFLSGNNVSRKVFNKESLKSSFYKNNYFVLLQFSVLPDESEKNKLKQVGIELSEFLPGNAYMATVKSYFDFSQATKFNILSVNVIPAKYKLDPLIKGYQKPTIKGEEKLIAVTFYSSINKDSVSNELLKAGAVIENTAFDMPDVIFIQADEVVANKLASLPFVSYVSLQSIKDKPLNYNDVATHGVSGLNALNGKNLNGKGVVIGVGDNSEISGHIDFAGRLIVRTPNIPESHGMHVSGTAAGAGIINVKNHGMAPKATIIDHYFSGIIANAPTHVMDNGMVLTNNSYYSTDVGCPGSGKYDVLSNTADLQLRAYPELLHVVASGNDGSLTCSPFPASYGTVKSGWQSAKNVLTVGAMDSETYQEAYFSSRGPLLDGRIKPEIMASGYGIISTVPNNTYGTNWGTSMAAPVVTGSLALVYEEYRKLHLGQNPKAALVKAIACNTAEDLGRTGPDFLFGFGMINTRRAVDAIDSARYFISSISNGSNTSHTITIKKNARYLKVMLYWADKEAAANVASALVNDLDLTVTEPSSTVHQPLILDPSPTNLTKVAVEGIDRVNNIEQVVIENPVAGSYSIKVNGFNVPFGPQEYVISYEVIDSSVVLEYPCGGETLVPGSTEVIRWSGYGSESNNFTVEYSANNGSSWTTLDNNVANKRKYNWTVPSTATNNALIRVKRNGTALSDKSNMVFTILGQPVLTATKACQDAVQLSWTKVTSATSYEVMMLDDDSMKVIASVTDTAYLVRGLNRYKVYWFGVRAKNGTSPGRRSLSVNIQPDGGPCSLTVFNNEIKIDTILEPTTARQFFANELNATKPVKVRIRNQSQNVISGPFDISYSYNGGASVTENVNTTIAAGGTYVHTFTTPYTILPQGFNYDFKAWVTKSSDQDHLNDTAYKTVKYINNAAITIMPVKENFDQMPVDEITSAEMAIGNNNHLDFLANTNRGRARTYVNTGFSRSGNRAITLDQFPYSGTTNVDSLIFSYNLSSYSASQLRLDFYYKNHGQTNSPGNRVWIRGDEASPWVEAYNLFLNQEGLGEWKRAIININDVLTGAVPSQTVSPTFQIKIGEQGNKSANYPHPETDIDDGYSVDDLSINEVFNDIAVTKINSPDTKGCNLTATTPISITIKNFNNVTLNNLQVSYQVSGNSIVTETIPSIGPNEVLDYTFLQTANLAAYIDYTIKVWAKYNGDNYAANDSLLDYEIHNSPVITSYPYLETFDNSDGYYYSKGTNNTWEWGAPQKTIIKKAASGTKVWTNSLTGDYKNNEISYLYSPCFDLNGLDNPVLSFSFIRDLETDFDYAWVEYSTDGIIWKKLGAVGQGTNWYDNASGVNWRTSINRWKVASIDIPEKNVNIRFRFVLFTDSGITQEGLGIDDIHIFDKEAIYTGSPVAGVTQNVNGNDWVNFSSGGKRIASLNAGGNNLGNTAVDIYTYPGPVRVYQNQYYVDRNIVIRPANPPAGGYVKVRFYFTDKEADSLIKANSCTSCPKPFDAYDLGVYKYSGFVNEENGTLTDDLTGFFQYIKPENTEVVPYDSGYYAEVSVTGFSEFWLNYGNTGGSQPVPLKLLSFDAIKDNNVSLLKWSTDNEINSSQFVIEKSADSQHFVVIGTVNANNTSGVNQYSFTDAQAYRGINYYRLKLIDRDGSVKYSDIRVVNFANGYVVYPNPVINDKLFLATSADCSRADLLDMSGRLMKTYKLQGLNNILNTWGFAKGMYQLKIFTANTVYTEKIMIQ